MLTVLYAVLVLGVLGCVFGAVLAFASKIFEVQKDPRVEEIQETLPGANCGGCGFAGCSACAAAIASGQAPVNACPVCSGERVSRIAAIMGVEVEAAERRVAFVRCTGGARANKKYEYIGISDCVGAMKVAGNGPLECAYGCLGFGNCVRACAFDAIHINENGVAEVDRDLCTNCGQCREACPRGLIGEIPYAADITVGCASKEKGAVSRQQCAASCIGCRLCEKNCPSDAIHVVDNVAVIDYSKCTSCGTCVSKCPRKVLTNIHDDGRVAPVA